MDVYTFGKHLLQYHVQVDWLARSLHSEHSVGDNVGQQRCKLRVDLGAERSTCNTGEHLAITRVYRLLECLKEFEGSALGSLKPL